MRSRFGGLPIRSWGTVRVRWAISRPQSSPMSLYQRLLQKFTTTPSDNHPLPKCRISLTVAFPVVAKRKQSATLNQIPLNTALTSDCKLLSLNIARVLADGCLPSFPSLSTTTMTANKQKSGKMRIAGVGKNTSEWAIQGMHLSDITYEENFDVDLEAAANDHSPHQARHTTKVTTTQHDNTLSGWELLQGSNYAETATSLEQNHGSVFDMVDISQVKSRRSHRQHEQVNEDSSPVWPPLFDTTITHPTTLDAWENTPHRHESLAYRLEQPAKRQRH